MEITPNKPIDKTTLRIVKESFEEQKNIKILSLYDDNENIYGVYIIHPYESLSFIQAPLLNMTTDIDGHGILMFELGALLHFIYQNGSMQMFNVLTRPSAIDCSNDCFHDLLDICIDNPPLLLSSFHLIEWIDKMNNGDLHMSIDDLMVMVENFIQVEPLDIDVSDKSCECIMKNNLNLVKQELKNRTYKKITEATINRIDKLFIKLQLDLYMTDDK